jgi:hypothetical protein
MEFHFNKLAMMTNKLNAIDVGVSDEVKVMVLLISLLERLLGFDHHLSIRRSQMGCSQRKVVEQKVN